MRSLYSGLPRGLGSKTGAVSDHRKAWNQLLQV